MSRVRRGPWSRHPVHLSLPAHPTVLPAPLGSSEARWPSRALPAPRPCFGVCVSLPRSSASPFLFLAALLFL